MRCNLAEIARRVMFEKGLSPIFPPEVDEEVKRIKPSNTPALDLTHLPFCSIDNDDSKDLDQLTFAEGNDIYVAIADVTDLVKKNSPIDRHAQINTTSVYTPDIIFTLIPKELCYDITSLNPEQKRLSVVVKMTLDEEADVESYEIFHAYVYNYAKLTYSKIGPMLANEAPFEPKFLESTLRLQDKWAQKIKKKRENLGALTLVTPESKPVVKDDEVLALIPVIKNRAHELIENFMISTNSTIATFLKNGKVPSLRRVVKVPERWDRIVVVAQELKYKLPPQPDAKALDEFLRFRQKEDPVTFPDLSLTVIKLLGSGEYIVEMPDDSPLGHFGLAILNYTHSTAPNRRYPDIITQRQVKALLNNEPSPYTVPELKTLADQCTHQEDQAKRVERHLTKSAAACLLHNRIGDTFKGIITGVSSKGTWVRIFDPPVEGKVVENFRKLDVGDHVNVKLVGVDIELGYIDFSNLKTNHV